MYLDKWRRTPIGQASFVSCLALLVTCDVLMGPPRVEANSAQDMIELVSPHPSVPAVVSNVMVNDTPVIPGKGFEGGDNWLRFIRVKITNETVKPIIAMTVDIEFPETGDGSPTKPFLISQVRLGSPPGSSQVGPGSNNPPINLPPGGSIAIDLGSHYPDYANLLNSSVLQGAMPHICRIRIIRVIFADETTWGGGGYLRPDPTRPGRHLPMQAGEFFNKTGGP